MKYEYVVRVGNCTYRLPSSWSVQRVRDLERKAHKPPNVFDRSIAGYKGKDRLAGVRKAPRRITDEKVAQLNKLCTDWKWGDA